MSLSFLLINIFFILVYHSHPTLHHMNFLFTKMNIIVNGQKFDTVEDIQTEAQVVAWNRLMKNKSQGAFNDGKIPENEVTMVNKIQAWCNVIYWCILGTFGWHLVWGWTESFIVNWRKMTLSKKWIFYNFKFSTYLGVFINILREKLLPGLRLKHWSSWILCKHANLLTIQAKCETQINISCLGPQYSWWFGNYLSSFSSSQTQIEVLNLGSTQINLL